MNFHLYDHDLSHWSGDCLIACCFAEGSTAALPSALEPLDQAWGGVMAELIQEQAFAAKLGSAVSTRVGSNIKKVVLT
ncbi:MAG: hypothetical protein HC818_04145, partial [Synechococcaceae cyanobacterium RM1_1_27]|nr:hypothetical protein [Synechococcaceae cyanobacterium RM1_1_27]